jgi:hypothetical protein
MSLFLLFLACSKQNDSATECTETFDTIPALDMVGGQPPYPCDQVCPTENEGKPFYDCYYDTNQQGFCQYGVPCP